MLLVAGLGTMINSCNSLITPMIIVPPGGRRGTNYSVVHLIPPLHALHSSFQYENFALMPGGWKRSVVLMTRMCCPYSQAVIAEVGNGGCTSGSGGFWYLLGLEVSNASWKIYAGFTLLREMVVAMPFTNMSTICVLLCITWYGPVYRICRGGFTPSVQSITWEHWCRSWCP